jgi:hypothetical protein
MHDIFVELHYKFIIQIRVQMQGVNSMILGSNAGRMNGGH